jgi:hypothetical protein
MSINPEFPQVPPPYLPQSSTLAIVSLIAGIVSWILVPLIGAIVAVITGHMAKSEIRNSNGRLTGDGMATAGLILGYIQIGLTVVAVCCVGALFVTGTLGAILSGNQH